MVITEVNNENKVYSTYAVFNSKEELEKAVNELIPLGFKNDDFSILYHSKDNAVNIKHEIPSKGIQGAVIGGSTGAIVGGALGFLAASSALFVPGIGAILAVGPVIGLLGGATLGGSFGGLSGALIGLGIPEGSVHEFEGKIKKGGILIAVSTEDPEMNRKAKEVLEHSDTESVSENPQDVQNYDTAISS